MTYYDILEVHENAPQEVIHLSYQAVVKKYHPDFYNGDPKIAEERMQQIEEAYAALADPLSRAHYDSFLEWNRKQGETDRKKSSKERRKAQKEPPSLGQSAATVSILFVIILFLDCLNYMSKYVNGDYTLEVALFGVILEFFLSISIYLIIPIWIGALKNNFTFSSATTLTWVTSFVLLFVSNIVAGQNATKGWLTAMLFAYICKHIVYQISQKPQKKWQKIFVACAVTVVSLLSVSIGLLASVIVDQLL